MWKFAFIIVFGSILFSCSFIKEKKVYRQELIYLPIDSCIDEGRYKIENLSSYVDSLEYIPLETNDTTLLGFIEPEMCFYKDGYFYLYDRNTNIIHKFSDAGSYITRIASQGGGPGEYVNVWAMDILNDKLYIKNRDISILEYTVDGKFLRTIPVTNPEIADMTYFSYHFKVLSENKFYLEMLSYVDGKYMGLFCNDMFQDIIWVKPKKEIVKQEGIQEAVMDTRFCTMEGNSYLYKIYTADTLYLIDTITYNLLPRYVINYGIKPGENMPVTPERFVGTEKYLFATFYFGSLAPEPFEVTFYRGGQFHKYTDTRVHTLFDKDTHRMVFLKQPIPKKLGLNNDIDNGIPFWPDFIAYDGQSLLMVCQAETFIETLKERKDVGNRIKELLDILKEDDNPIIIKAYLKE